MSVEPITQARHPRPGRWVTDVGDVLVVRSVTWKSIRKPCAAVTTSAWLPMTEAPYTLPPGRVVLLAGNYLPPEPVTVSAPDEALALACALVDAGQRFDAGQRTFELAVANGVHLEVRPAPGMVADMVGSLMRVRDAVWGPRRSEDAPGFGLARSDFDVVAYALRRVVRERF